MKKKIVVEGFWKVPNFLLAVGILRQEKDIGTFAGMRSTEFHINGCGTDLFELEKWKDKRVRVTFELIKEKQEKVK